MKLKPLDLIWLALLAATAFTWWLGFGGALAQGRFVMTAVVFVLAWFKGMGVLLEFMELRHAPRRWRRALAGGLSVVVILILVAAFLGARQT